MNPKISIIVPIYKVETYLHKCIDSILVQTFRDFELILVDDGSPDNCGEICEAYAQKDSRVKVIHKANGGLSDARNTGIQKAKGEYIGFVDGDDWIDPDMYEVLYNLVIKNNAAISTCLLKSHYQNKRGNHRQYSKEIKALDAQTAIHSMYAGELSGYSACNKLYNKSIFQDIKFPLNRVYEDAAVMYRLFDKANKIVFLDYPLYHHIYRKKSITQGRFSEKRFDIVLNYNETYNFMEKNYPKLCNKLEVDYFSSLRNMIVDLINEKNVFKNYKYVSRISNLIKNEEKKILKNDTLSLKFKIFAIALGWFPWLGILLYKTRFVHLSFLKGFSGKLFPGRVKTDE